MGSGDQISSRQFRLTHEFIERGILHGDRQNTIGSVAPGIGSAHPVRSIGSHLNDSLNMPPKFHLLQSHMSK